MGTRRPINEYTSILTTGQMAKICQVASRTVSKWFDSGELKGYKIPGSQDRRIPIQNAIQFLQEKGMPLGALEQYIIKTRVLLAGVSDSEGTHIIFHKEMKGIDFYEAHDPWEFGSIVVDKSPNVIVLDFSISNGGTGAAVDQAKRSKKRLPDTNIIAVVSEDCNVWDLRQMTKELFCSVVKRPLNLDEFVKLIKMYLPEKGKIDGTSPSQQNGDFESVHIGSSSQEGSPPTCSGELHFTG